MTDLNTKGQNLSAQKERKTYSASVDSILEWDKK